MVRPQPEKRVFHPKARINRKTKVAIEFDEKARREFLSGFRKRKLERQKKAQEELKQKLAEEKKKIKLRARETYKKMVASHHSIPEIDNLLSKEYEVDNTKVTIKELSMSSLAKENNWIGENKVEYENNEESNDQNSSEEEEEIPGMGLKEISPKKEKGEKESDTTLKSKKDIKKVIKHQATKQVQKSKAFQIKNKIEKQKNKKKSMKKKNLDMKSKKQSKKYKKNKH